MNRFEEKWISHMNEAKDLGHLHRIHDAVCLKKCKAFRDCSRCAIEQHYQFLKEGFLVMKEIELHIKTRGSRIERKGVVLLSMCRIHGMGRLVRKRGNVMATIN